MEINLSLGCCRAPRTPRGLPSVAAAPLYLDLRSREGGRPGVGCAVFGSQGGLLRGWRFALCVGFAECGNTPPAPRCASALPPRFGGLLGEEFSVEVRVGLMNLTADLEVPLRKTQTFNKPRDRPVSGGQRRRRGGHVLAFCTTCNKKPTSGGQRRRRGGHVLALCTTCNKPPREPKTAHPTPSLPPSRTQ